MDILSPDVKEVEFSYSVDWIEEPQSKWADRMLRYVDSRFIPSTFEVRVGGMGGREEGWEGREGEAAARSLFCLPLGRIVAARRLFSLF